MFTSKTSLNQNKFLKNFLKKILCLQHDFLEIRFEPKTFIKTFLGAK